MASKEGASAPSLLCGYARAIGDPDIARWLDALDASIAAGELAEPLPVLALVAGRDVVLDDDERRAARRRAVLLLATGGDPRRGFELDSRAVTALAADLENNDRRAALQRGLLELRGLALDRPCVARALDALLADPAVAWRAFACGLLAEEIAEE